MKKFVCKLLLFLILLALVVIPVNVCVDPYNVFHVSDIRDNGVEPNKNFIKTKFVLQHKEEYDSYLFGSSRAGFVDVSQIKEGNWYNFSYSEGLPREHYETLKALIAGGEIPKRVWISIDNIAYLVDPALHESQLYRKAYPFTGNFKEKLDFYVSYLDTVTTLESIPVIRAHEGDTEELRNRLYSTGNEQMSFHETFDDAYDMPYWSDYYEPRIEEAVLDMADIRELCETYGIELTVFTNPLYIRTYERSVDKQYLDFLEQLVKVVPFYNFSGYNPISMDKNLYYENSHFRKEAGKMMIDIIENGGNDDINQVYGQGYGFYATHDNFAELLEILQLQVYVTGILQYEE